MRLCGLSIDPAVLAEFEERGFLKPPGSVLLGLAVSAVVARADDHPEAFVDDACKPSATSPVLDPKKLLKPAKDYKIGEEFYYFRDRTCEEGIGCTNWEYSYYDSPLAFADTCELLPHANPMNALVWGGAYSSSNSTVDCDGDKAEHYLRFRGDRRTALMGDVVLSRDTKGFYFSIPIHGRPSVLSILYQPRIDGFAAMKGFAITPSRVYLTDDGKAVLPSKTTVGPLFVLDGESAPRRLEDLRGSISNKCLQVKSGIHAFKKVKNDREYRVERQISIYGTW